MLLCSYPKYGVTIMKYIITKSNLNETLKLHIYVI